MHTLSTRSHCAAVSKTKQWVQVVHVRVVVEVVERSMNPSVRMCGTIVIHFVANL